jgi:hypothetical protein
MIKRFCTFVFFFIFLGYIQLIFAFPNYRLFPSTVTQTEPIVCVSPLNPLIMFASAVTINTSNGFKSEGVYVTTNGGLSWFGSDTCKGQSIFNHGGDPGVVIDKNGIFIITHIGSLFTGVYSHYSSDYGLNWSSSYTLTSQQPEDKGTLTTDNLPGSPYYGRTYCSWVNFVSPFPVLVSYTTNSAVSWTSPVAINSPPPSRCSGGYIHTGPNGEVYDVWSGVPNVTPFTEDFAGFAVSINGGVTWSVYQNIFDMNGINGTLTSKGNIRVNGLPRIGVDLTNGSRRGWIYVITTEKNIAPAGSDPDILLHRSTNSGLTWSAGIKVNKDPINNGKIQYFPAIEIDSTGAVNILYYDDRNTSSDSAEVYLSRSNDGGNSWNEYLISEHRFKPKAILGGPSSYQGDFISLLANGSKLYSIWMDDYSGTYQIWTALIDLNTIGINKIDTKVPEKYSIFQNYPNPFNPSTRIRFDIPQYAILSGANNQWVELKIYDILGHELTTLVNEHLQPGTYEIQWDGSNYPSGTYFYKIDAGDFVQSKKMILIK